MSEDPSGRVEELLWQARQLAPDERQAFLDAQCADDPAVRAEVESLLEHAEASTSFLETPAVARVGDPARALPQVTEVGGYRILDVIAEGGMGIVYRAEQDNPRRLVALKLIRPGIATTSMLRRFEVEAQILGRLQHPGIAQIFEAGTADVGAGAQPYFAMELIEGPSLTDYANAKGLGTRERLELMTSICEAIQHAHARGIIHRDLKPSNILVDPSGQPRILDFGVARVTDSDTRSTTQHTDIGQLIGTIPYMSPEQCTGRTDDLDTRSDIYALGVICYELLTGTQPYELREKMLYEAARIIREADPRPLSSINRAFRGDVETIIGKSLDKDRNRRYQTAADMAADITRYLRHEPIVARPAGSFYKFAKFTRRHRVLVAATLLVAVSIGLGVTATTREAIRARHAEQAAVANALQADTQKRIAEERLREVEQARDETRRAMEDAEATNDFLRDMLGAVDPRVRLGPDVTVREVLDLAARDVDGRFTGRPLVAATVRQTIGVTYLNLGLVEDSARQLRSTLETRRALLGDDHPETLGTMVRLAGALLRTADIDEAAMLMRESLAAHRRVLGDDDARTLTAQRVFASVLQGQGDLVGAERELREALDRSGAALGPDEDVTLMIQATLGVVLDEAGRTAEAEAVLASLVETRIRLDGPRHVDTLTARGVLAGVRMQLGHYDAAESEAGAVIRDGVATLGPTHPLVIRARVNRAMALRRLRRVEEAIDEARGAVEAAVASLGSEHSETLFARDVVVALLNAAALFEESEPAARQMVAIRTRLDGSEHRTTLNATSNLATALAGLDRLDEAVTMQRGLLQTYERINGERHPDTRAIMSNLGWNLQQQGSHDEAERVYRRLVDIGRATNGADHPAVLQSTHQLVLTLHALGRDEEAEPLARELVAVADRVLAENQWQRGTFRYALAVCLVALDRREAAVTELETSIGLLESAVGPDHWSTRAARERLDQVRDGESDG